MKLFYSFVLFACALFGFGSALAQQPNQLSTTLVFIDKSASVSFTENGALLPKSSNAAAQAVNLLKASGDRLIGYYLHSGAGAASQMHISSVPQKAVGETPLRQKAIDRAFKTQFESIRSKCYNALHAGLKQPIGSSGQTSPILKSLEIASEQMPATGTRTLIYFSDMVECSGIRKTLAPRNKADAEAMARTDAAKVRKEYSIKPVVLNGAIAHVYLPQSAMASGGNANIPYYWTELFRQFGIRASFH